MSSSLAPSEVPRSRRTRSDGAGEIIFPVTPMLDMAFQLLAFFILTFKAPSDEMNLDLDLPATPAALPSVERKADESRAPRQVDSDLENDLLVRARADDLGDLKSLHLGDSPVPDLAALGDRLRKYDALLDGKPLRVRLVADETLRYEPVAQIVAVCQAAGATAVRLNQPGSVPEIGNRP